MQKVCKERKKIKRNIKISHQARLSPSPIKTNTVFQSQETSIKRRAIKTQLSYTKKKLYIKERDAHFINGNKKIAIYTCKKKDCMHIMMIGSGRDKQNWSDVSKLMSLIMQKMVWNASKN